ncbi:glycosyltransferase [Blastopirellula retiformator]|uniref:4-alpha-N-acetylgalactosaminyltransferase n=1 Tax=Blastopirellula retiformator TaxID=2527970 RepID=A0A5C5V5J2_9BACT|nr:glycosyltransferase [Blastopirellula retiformator]TWT33233.1 4-alpha-N-acetylgalactosaminyltransferase [Blastopirellula retiformator]
MKRLLLIIPTLDRGGAEKQLTMLATGLPRAQFDVHVCLLTRSGPLEETLRAQDIPIVEIRKRRKLDPLAYLRLKKEIKRLAPDIVHTWIFAANAYGRSAAQAVKVPHIICGERCVDPWKQGYEIAIDRYLDRKTDKIAVNSSGIEQFYVEKGRDPKKFVVIPNGIDATPPPAPLSREQLLRQLDLPYDSRLLVAVGRLWPQKRLKDLIWSIDILNRIRSDVHLLIIGDGPQRDRLKKFARQANTEGSVHFLGARNDVPQIMAHADCFLLASGYEGQSNALMEAMVAGVPAIVSDIPGNRDLVVSEKTGFLVPLGQRAEYSRYTNIVLEDDDLRRRLGQAAQERIAAEFSIPQMIQRHIDLYDEVAST